jgi:hypothetical protein
MKTRTKVGKDGLLQFYTGRKKATDTEIKQFIKKNYEITPKEKLPKEYSQYLGRVKGGHNRQKQALRNEEGTFMPQDLQKQLVKQMGVDIEKIKEGRGFDSYDKLFKDLPNIQKQFERIQSTGIERSHNKSTAAKKAMEFTGKIFINGKEVTGKNAAKRLNSTFNKLKRQFGNIDASVKFRYKGTKELRINIPTDSIINEYDDSNEFLENYEHGEDWEIYGSDPNKYE